MARYLFDRVVCSGKRCMWSTKSVQVILIRRSLSVYTVSNVLVDLYSPIHLLMLHVSTLLFNRTYAKVMGTGIVVVHTKREGTRSVFKLLLQVQ
jgi:hypothetical protein